MKALDLHCPAAKISCRVHPESRMSSACPLLKSCVPKLLGPGTLSTSRILCSLVRAVLAETNSHGREPSGKCAMNWSQNVWTMHINGSPLQVQTRFNTPLPCTRFFLRSNRRQTVSPSLQMIVCSPVADGESGVHLHNGKACKSVKTTRDMRRRKCAYLRRHP